MIKSASINLIKSALSNLSSNELTNICLKLVKYKKDNKELLSYLLFDSNNEADYIKLVKAEISLQFSEINKSQMFYVRKSIRKILRITNKYIRYSGKAQTEVELLIHFCSSMNDSGVDFRLVNSMTNLYHNQVQKINRILSTLHEDLQFDYREEISRLSLK
ncbi:MAG: hypothetical protein Q8S18_03570 [Bacteroidales bacterium]|nr:hypothetical protein [Bacteroidales bacterium]